MDKVIQSGTAAEILIISTLFGYISELLHVQESHSSYYYFAAPCSLDKIHLSIHTIAFTVCVMRPAFGTLRCHSQGPCCLRKADLE